ncbi:MAG: glycosyltransferase family 4 protein [Gaiellaceae bacterium]
MKIVVDALQVPAELSGVGRQALELGSQLRGLPPGTRLEVRCAADVRGVFEGAYPAGTRFRTPIRRSRPRLLRILVQQLLFPALDRRSTLLVCLGDQAPLLGRARRLLVVNDVRRLTDDGGGLERRYYRFLLPRAVRRATVVATISQFSRTEIVRTLGVDSVVIAHHPAPVRAAPAAAGEFLLVVGALRPYKGSDLVVDALARLDEDARRPVVFAGPPEGHAGALRARAAAAGVRVDVRGWVDETELRGLYDGAYAVVCPSTYEGYGLPVAEGLAHGQAVVASDIPPHREIGGDAVSWFRPGDAGALAEALEALPTVRSALAGRAVGRARELAAVRPTWLDVVTDAASVR